MPGKLNVRVAVGLAATLCVFDYLFWGGAFVAVRNNPFARFNTLAWFTSPCTISIGLSLIFGARLLLGRGHRPRSLCIGAFGCQILSVLLLSGLLVMEDAPVAALSLSAVLAGTGIGLAVLGWQWELCHLETIEVMPTVCAAFIASPLASAALLLMPAATYNMLTGILSCMSTLPLVQDGGAAVDAEPYASQKAGMALRGIVQRETRTVMCICSIAVVVGVSRTMALTARDDAGVVTFGALAGGLVAALAVIATTRPGRRASSPENVYTAVFAASGLSLVAAFLMGGSAEFFSCSAQCLFVVVTITTMMHYALRQEGPRSTAACGCSIGLAYLALGVGHIAGIVLGHSPIDGVTPLAAAAVVCAYVLSAPLVFLLRRRCDPPGTGDAAAVPVAPPAQTDVKIAMEAAEKYGLSARETDVLRLTLRGMESPQMAKRLCLSDNTVRSHKKNLYRKLGVHSKSELFGVVLPKELQDEEVFLNNPS